MFFYYFIFVFRWGFVVYGGIDGYFRYIMYFKCNCNNRVVIILEFFFEVVDIFGLLFRVRGDKGVKKGWCGMVYV